MKLYYVEMLSWNVAGDEIWPVLSEYQGKHGFKQGFERAWSALEFKSPLEALVFCRTMLPEQALFLSEDETSILMLGQDHADHLYRLTVEVL